MFYRERINHEFYSFSSDIWSLGLTLLTVADGKFPLVVKDETVEKGNVIVGGPKGFWTMIQAICDQDPPEAGPSYSLHFNEFISSCLQKDPLMRGTASQLLESLFIVRHLSAQGISASILMPNNIANDSSTFDGKNFILDESNGDEEGRIIYAIRMEHLERILTKLSQRIISQKSMASATVDDSCKKDLIFNAVDTKKNINVHKADSKRESHVHFDQQALQVNDEKERKRKNKPQLKLWDLQSDFQDAHLNKRANSFGQPVPIAVIHHESAHQQIQFPRFDKHGLQKWKNLSMQLHIPLPIVLIAARAKLGHVIDLDVA